MPLSIYYYKLNVSIDPPLLKALVPPADFQAMYLHCFRRSQLTYEVWILHHLSKLGIGIYHITHLGIQPKNLTVEITLES